MCSIVAKSAAKATELPPPTDHPEAKDFAPLVNCMEPSTFTIGDVNSTAAIRALTSINNISIEELERLMRPGGYSSLGFLGPEESLLEVLAMDNVFVLAKGITHRELAKHLKYLARMLEGFTCSFEYLGQKIEGSFDPGCMEQRSPFKDDSSSPSEYTLTNKTNGKTIHFPGLLPVMIERYGFYEGTGTPWRVGPSEIMSFLGLD